MSTPRIYGHRWHRQTQRVVKSTAPVLIPLTRAERILKLVCALYGISRAELTGVCRAKYLVDARQYAAIRLTKEIGLSRPQTARLLGYQNHTTVYNLVVRRRARQAARLAA